MFLLFTFYLLPTPSSQTNPSFFVLFFLPPISRYLYADPVHCNMTHLLFRLLKDDLKEYTYAARLTGLVYDVASGMNALLVSKLFGAWGGERW